MSGVQVRAEILSCRPVGAYHSLTMVAPGVAERARPGQFIAIGIGGPESALLLRRAFALHKVSRRGVYGGTLEIVFAVVGAGTAWLARRQAHETLDIVGPLGRPFTLPRDACSTVLVGGGYGSATLFGLAEALRDRGCRVEFAMGAASGDRLFGTLEAKRMAQGVAFATEDGSLGARGVVTDLLPRVLQRARADVVYACGPMGMLAAVAGIAAAHGLPCQVAVEESMACGIGVCMSCVLPVVSSDGRTRMTRACVDGPVFHADRVRFADIGTVPADAVGAPQ